MSDFDLKQALALTPKLLHNPQNLPYTTIAKAYPKADGRIFRKSEILAFYLQYAGTHGLPKISSAHLSRLRTKPVRSLSGITPITVLTKPYPCPGDCIFCPSDVRMPKSYLSREPGAQRAANAAFDPYLQVYSRLEAYREMGHPIQKIELIVLGGTWSVYPLPYRLWFIKRLFDALNDFSRGLAYDQPAGQLSLKIPPLKSTSKSYQFNPPPTGQSYNQAIQSIYGTKPNPSETATWAELTAAHKLNQDSLIRCVGLVLETRPDYVTPAEAITLRRLGATKIQLGIQSLNNRVLKLNRRGHNQTASVKAIQTLRLLGFKLHLHWMPNLYGSTVALDKRDYQKLFSKLEFRPDELKIYPCSLIPGTDLMAKYHQKLWRPYNHRQLTDILSYCLTHTPRYCRITRMVRDIASHDIAAGNKLTNFRQIAESHAQAGRGFILDIRAREIKGLKVDLTTLKLKKTRYQTTVSQEYFLEFITPSDQIAAFLRLSLPSKPTNRLVSELNHSAMIREVHVYGQALNIKTSKSDQTQHSGLGKRLILQANLIAKEHGYHRLSVISAVGTRVYYQKLGFKNGRLYQHLAI